MKSFFILLVGGGLVVGWALVSLIAMAGAKDSRFLNRCLLKGSSSQETGKGVMRACVYVCDTGWSMALTPLSSQCPMIISTHRGKAP